eukprot:scaffold6835_cov26-Tisochrysis_lutea.AAC.3
MAQLDLVLETAPGLEDLWDGTRTGKARLELLRLDPAGVRPFSHTRLAQPRRRRRADERLGHCRCHWTPPGAMGVWLPKILFAQPCSQLLAPST